MARQAVCDAVEAHLASNWNKAAIFGENLEAQTPRDGSAYVLVQYPFVNSRQISVGAPGNNLWRDDGAFRVVIHVPRGSGTIEGREWADEIAALFRGRDMPALRTWAPTAPVTDDRNAKAAYYVLSFSVPYSHDYYG